MRRQPAVLGGSLGLRRKRKFAQTMSLIGPATAVSPNPARIYGRSAGVFATIIRDLGLQLQRQTRNTGHVHELVCLMLNGMVIGEKSDHPAMARRATGKSPTMRATNSATSCWR